MALSYAQKFGSSNQAENCNSLNNGGSLVLVGTLGKCLKEPDVYVLEVDAAVTALDEIVNVFIQSVPVGVTTPSVYLQQGQVLAFTADAGLTYQYATVAADIEITEIATPGQAVSINPAVEDIAAASLANYWGLYRLLAPEGFDVTINPGKESATNLNAGLKTKEVVTSLALAGNLSMILEADDPGYWKILHNAAVTGGDLFAIVAKPGGIYTWGNTQIGNYARPGQKQSLQKATMEFMFQDVWLSPPMYKYLPAPDQLLMQEVLRLSGLKVPA